MSKMTGLQAQLERVTGKVAVSTKQPVSTVEPKTDVATSKASSREGKIHLGAYLHPDFKRSLRLVQAQTGEDTQTIIARALNDLFRGHNVPVIDQD